MNVPGSNLLAMALSVITPQVVVLYQWTGRAPNRLGEYVDTFAAGVPVEGSWQSVDTKDYADLGLDLAKSYFTFYTTENIRTIARDTGVDQVRPGDGRVYETCGNLDWRFVDGWKSALFVDIGPDV